MFPFNSKSQHSIFLMIPLLAIMGLIFYKFVFITDHYFAFGIPAINTAIHEGGHMLFGLFGNRFLSIAGGTILQLLIPILVGIGFIRQRDNFGVSLIFAWLGINLFHISVYAGDAIVGRLPLLLLYGGNASNYTHDRSYMLTETGLIYHTDLISDGIWLTAELCFIIFFTYTSILIFNRIKDREW